ncbi:MULTISPECIES: phosphatidate cytidylyltransferase [Pelosinus]|uniref:Phosphatidate cytidylyltransferase n=2 Tax=Pelosinus TaxID=365348 RepID=I8U0D0_9FIRM|nr:MULTISPECIES: phosphatidate cytidylyltransferase [Pelosinus]AJQ27354.1 phosphatidate cytidylyltransferase [Pelosinus fermentans JBW45]MCC5464986.1 phosphatidate cytidylyltransferase [Pelosinus baikalensis]
MLGRRVLTAVIGIPITIYVIHYGEWLFAAAILILTLLAWHEFYTMLRNKNIKVFYNLGILMNALILGCAWLGNSQEMTMTFVFATLLCLVNMVVSGNKFTVADVAFSILGITYIGVGFSHLLLLRYTDSSLYITTSVGTLSMGASYLWLAFIGTWANDTFAYFVGSRFGRRKLCPAISPAKTVEGSIGGLVGSILAITLLGLLFKLPVSHSIAMGLVVGVIAPIGDLAESAIKRFAGVKDSGKLLPGHGGILDRFDSILFTVPIVYYYIHMFLLR